MGKLIYIVEDERDIADLVEHYLKKDGFKSEAISDGPKALERIRRQPPDLLVLDLMLPGLDGLELCRILRAEPATKRLPIIMLTAKAEETDKIVGLEMGADDYLTKPFSPKELMARIRAIFRRNLPVEEEKAVLNYGKIILDGQRHVVSVSKKEVELTAKEFGLLEYLLKRPGRVLSREQILNSVWGQDYYGGNRTVDVHIRHLRKKIPLLDAAILTVKSFGYKLKEEA
ncbi:response regulator transcription factor [candidate division TA06 bacterium]|uniref:Response regulator transcription factor n=1 Tax=candidate division TA06 bacterium TaxID=2250710 RepID=A0A933MIZ2_UNCT6|nr:response regulator transcription factor [candidate division TA06 bacterium]